jgi:WXG100 family type VII secretion target
VVRLSVAFEDLREVARRLHEGEIAIRDTISGLKSEVDALIGAGFATDKAADSFAESFAEVDEALRQALGGLEDMRTTLTKAADAYEAADEELAKGWGASHRG